MPRASHTQGQHHSGSAPRTPGSVPSTPAGPHQPGGRPPLCRQGRSKETLGITAPRPGN